MKFLKTLALVTFIAVLAFPAFPQALVTFNNRIAGTLRTRVYGGGSSMRIGNGTDDTPSGTTDWTGYLPLSGSNWMAAIRAAVGGNQPESSLTFGINPTTTTFRVGLNAGGFRATTATLSEIPPDAPIGTIEVFAWDRLAGGDDPAAAFNLWQSGQILGGVSGAMTVHDLGGVVNTPVIMTGLQSFNVWLIPEPSLLAFATAGCAACVIVNRRRTAR